MGSFFGKGKDKDGADKGKSKDELKSPVVPTRASRRAVIPGSAPANPRPNPMGTGSQMRPGAPKNSGAPAVQAPSVFARPKAPGSGLASTGASSDSDHLVLAPGESPGRPDTKGPILNSSAPQFAGSLASSARTTGPCRTGDGALIDFMVVKAKLISREQADLISAKAQRDGLALDAAAVVLKVVTEDALVNALTQECWVPHLKVDKYEIRKKALDTVSREDAVHFSVFPVDKLGSLLTLAMVNPLDADTIRTLESKTGLDIKRVVATRSEIQQGIEKYYSGRVEAKDTSISFTADAAMETKSVTQMLGNVKASDSSLLNDSSDIAAPILFGDQLVTPEIQDIDDLLSADEIIAPAIIDSRALDMDLPLIVPAGEIIEIAEAPILDTPALEARSLRTTSLPELSDDTDVDEPRPLKPAVFSFDDTPVAAPAINPPVTPLALVPLPQVPAAKAPAPIKPVAPLPVAKPPSTTRIAAPEFELDDTDSLQPVIQPAVKPATEVRPVVRSTGLFTATPPAVPPRSLPPPTPIARPSTAAVARPSTVSITRPPTAAIARPVTTSITRSASGQHNRVGSSSNLFPARTGSGRVANPKVINLIPVLEEEFQHAITHGKAHVFEKWVGLQGRNRIINAVPVDAEFDDLLAGLYHSAR